MDFWLVVLPILFLGFEAAGETCLAQSLLTLDTVMIEGTFSASEPGSCAIRSKPDATLCSIAFQDNGMYTILSNGVSGDGNVTMYSYAYPAQKFRLSVTVLDHKMMLVDVEVDGLYQASFVEISNASTIDIAASRVIDCSKMESWSVTNRQTSEASDDFACPDEVPLNSTPAEIGGRNWDSICVPPLVEEQNVTMAVYITDKEWDSLLASSMDSPDTHTWFHYASLWQPEPVIDTFMQVDQGSNYVSLSSANVQYFDNYTDVNRTLVRANLIKWIYMYTDATLAQIAFDTGRGHTEYRFQTYDFPVDKPSTFRCSTYFRCAIISERMHTDDISGCQPRKCGKGSNRRRRNSASSSNRRDQPKTLLGDLSKRQKKP